MSKNFWIIVAAIVVVLIGIFTLTGKNSSNSSSNSNSNKPTQHIVGKGSTGVTLVEYGDYQCPYCGQYYATVQQVVQQYLSQITYQFRNFPLTSIHQNAFAAARAAEAAGLMGKFWQMHALLYEQNQKYYNSNGATAGWIGASDPEPVFVKDAVSLGLDSNKFQTYYSSEQVNNLITADQAAGNNLNVNATPSFYLDGKLIQVNNSVQSFSTLIDKAIAQKSGKATTSSSASQTQKTQQSKQ